MPNGLTQTLASNERGVAVYDSGVFIGYEDIVTLTQEELDEITEWEAMARAEQLIDSVNSLPELKTLLKRLVRRLIRNGALP